MCALNYNFVIWTFLVMFNRHVTTVANYAIINSWPMHIRIIRSIWKCLVNVLKHEITANLLFVNWCFLFLNVYLIHSRKNSQRFSLFYLFQAIWTKRTLRKSYFGSRFSSQYLRSKCTTKCVVCIKCVVKCILSSSLPFYRQCKHFLFCNVWF